MSVRDNVFLSPECNNTEEQPQKFFSSSEIEQRELTSGVSICRQGTNFWGEHLQTCRLRQFVL